MDTFYRLLGVCINRGLTVLNFKQLSIQEENNFAANLLK